MITGVETTVIASAQNTAGTRPAGNNAAAPKEKVVNSGTSATNSLSEQKSPVTPEGFNTLLEAQEGSQTSAFDDELTPEEEKQVQELKKRDAEVRAHEAAHKTAGGPVAGNVTFETVTGPDGREYAVAGEVQIDASPVANNPEATIRKMELVIRAALAPAEPSPQDRAVAAAAQQTKLQAQQEAAQQRADEEKETNENNGLGILSQENNLQKGDSGVQTTAETDLGRDNSDDIVSILFGNNTT